MKPINKFEIYFPSDYSVMKFLFNCLNFRKIFNISQYHPSKTDEHNIFREIVVNDTYFFRTVEEYREKRTTGVGGRTNVYIAKLTRESIWKSANLYISIVPNIIDVDDVEIKNTYKFLTPMQEISEYDGYRINISRGRLYGGQSSPMSLDTRYVERIQNYISENQIRRYSIIKKG